MLRLACLPLLLLAACAARQTPSVSSEAAPVAAADPARARLDDARREVAAIAAAARDATATLRAEDDARWDTARVQVPTPLDRAYLERSLGEHARRHGLELSQFRLGPMTLAQLDFPETLHPSAPYPLRAAHAIVQPPFRFALTPLRPDRVEAFVRTLPEVTPLVVVQAIDRGMDYVQIEATAPTFRQLSPEPRFALEVPQREALLGGAQPTEALEQDYRALESEVVEANELLAALSDARLRHERIRAYELVRAAAEKNARAIELPPAARAGAPAPRTTAP